MDPFSIVVGCISLIGTLAQASNKIAAVIKNFREARPELMRLGAQLQQLHDILNLLEHESTHGLHDDAGNLSGEAEDQVKEVINRCLGIMDELNDVLDSTNGTAARFEWAFTGKTVCASLERTLSDELDHLKLILQIQTRSTTTDIKKDTTTILDWQMIIDARITRLSEHLGVPSETALDHSRAASSNRFQEAATHQYSRCDELVSNFPELDVSSPFIPFFDHQQSAPSPILESPTAYSEDDFWISSPSNTAWSASTLLSHSEEEQTRSVLSTAVISFHEGASDATQSCPQFPSGYRHANKSPPTPTRSATDITAEKTREQFKRAVTERASQVCCAPQPKTPAPTTPKLSGAPRTTWSDRARKRLIAEGFQASVWNKALRKGA